MQGNCGAYLQECGFMRILLMETLKQESQNTGNNFIKRREKKGAKRCVILIAGR